MYKSFGKYYRHKFPLYKNDGMPAESYANWNRPEVEQFLSVIESGKLHLIQNHCLCNNEHSENDIVVSEKDRFGLPFKFILCSKCGIIRCDMKFDEVSNNLFYEEYYRKIYPTRENLSPKTNFHKEQLPVGNNILETIKQAIPIDKITTVVDIGCSSGGIAYPFYLNGKKVSGYDFCVPFLEYGKSMGLDLHYGDYYTQLKNNSCDLLIANHSFEHFLEPLNEIKKMLNKIKVGGYLFLAVPSIYSIELNYKDPLTYFQGAHIYNFYEQFLRVLFEQLNMKIIYGDKKGTFICQKTNNEIPNLDFIYDIRLAKAPIQIANYLLECKKNHDDPLKKTLKQNIFEWACLLGWKKIRPYIKHKQYKNE